MPRDAPRTKLDGTRALRRRGRALRPRARRPRGDRRAARGGARRGARAAVRSPARDRGAGHGRARARPRARGAARRARRALRAVQRRRSRCGLGARDQVRCSPTAPSTPSSPSATRGSRTRSRPASGACCVAHAADDLRRPPRAGARRDHVRDQQARARGRRCGRRRNGARGDGARGRASEARSRAVGRCGARRAASRPAARAALRWRDPLGRQRRRRIIVERADDAPRDASTSVHFLSMRRRMFLPRPCAHRDVRTRAPGTVFRRVEEGMRSAHTTESGTAMDHNAASRGRGGESV